jgi:PAS domain S-box-containing protein
MLILLKFYVLYFNTYDTLIYRDQMDLKKLLKLSADLICTVDIENRFVEVSEASFTILGYQPAEMCTRSYLEFILPQDINDAEQAIFGLRTAIPNLEIQNRYLHKDGRVIPLLWCVQWDEEDQLLYCIARNGNITEQTELMRESLEESNRRYQYVTKATSDAIWDWNIVQDTLYWGEGFETIFGYAVGKLPPGLQAWTQYIHPDDSLFVLQSIRAICASEETNWKEEYRYQKADGTYAEVVDRGFVIRDKDGKAIRMVGAMHDITERKRSLHEMGRITTDLFERNRELHEFAYITSHNLRSPVANIKSLVTLLEMEPDIPFSLRPYLANLDSSICSLDEVIIDLSQILSANNRTAQLKVESLDLRIIVALIKSDLSAKIAQCQAQINISGESMIIYSHEAFIYNILYNLIANSIKYRSDRPPLVNIEVIHRAEQVTLLYTDNSCGIDLACHGENVFKPYKAFHPTIKGKGLGLFLVKSYIESLGGSVHLKSNVCAGLVFTINLPNILNP